MTWFISKKSQRLTCFQSETFTPYPSTEVASADGIGYDPSVHGSTGPIDVSFSPFIYNQTRNVFAALNELGIPTSLDPNDASAAGAAFLPVSLNPVSQIRADARRSHNSTIYSRPNLDTWTGQHVTRILFEGGSGNSSSTDPDPGDTSLGQGNATNPDGALFGVRNTTDPTLLLRSYTKPMPKRKRSVVSRLFSRFNTWLGLKPRQASIQGPPTPTGQKLRVIGVEVRFI